MNASTSDGATVAILDADALNDALRDDLAASRRDAVRYRALGFAALDSLAEAYSRIAVLTAERDAAREEARRYQRSIWLVMEGER